MKALDIHDIAIHTHMMLVHMMLAAATHSSSALPTCYTLCAIVLQFLRKNLSLQSCVDVLLLASQYHCAELRRDAVSGGDSQNIHVSTDCAAACAASSPLNLACGQRPAVYRTTSAVVKSM